MKHLKRALNLSGRLIRNPLFALEIVYNIFYEKLNGIETYKKVISYDLGIPMELMPVDYAGSGNSYLGRVLKDLKISDKDSIIDLGCGKGGALLYMTKFPFRMIAGIEYSQAVFLKAKDNLEKMKQNQIQLIHGDAGSFDGFDDFNYVYMFNPFGSVTMSRVMNRISESYKKEPRDIFIIYKNPECHTEVLENGVVKKIAEYKSEWKQFRFNVYKTNA
jgi:SAM-dependent methyltransferase